MADQSASGSISPPQSGLVVYNPQNNPQTIPQFNAQFNTQFNLQLNSQFHIQHNMQFNPQFNLQFNTQVHVHHHTIVITTNIYGPQPIHDCLRHGSTPSSSRFSAVNSSPTSPGVVPKQRQPNPNSSKERKKRMLCDMTQARKAARQASKEDATSTSGKDGQPAPDNNLNRPKKRMFHDLNQAAKAARQAFKEDGISPSGTNVQPAPNPSSHRPSKKAKKLINSNDYDKNTTAL